MHPTEDTATVEQQVERLAHELVRLVNSLPGEGRDELREHVIGLLQNDIQEESDDADNAEHPGVPPAASFNPLGIGIPVLLMSGVFFVIFPPLGLVLFAVAALLMTWGVLTTLVAGRSARER